MGFGQLLKTKLEQKGIKQADLADNVGIGRTTLNSIIVRDTSKIKIETFLKICNYIGCDPEEFFDEFMANENKTVTLNDSLTINEKRLLDAFRQLDDIQQENIMARAELLAEQNNESTQKGSG